VGSDHITQLEVEAVLVQNPMRTYQEAGSIAASLVLAPKWHVLLQVASVYSLSLSATLVNNFGGGLC
jgi:hypothetical protein